MDRMRESVFAILGNLDGLSFLDLFSGSGVIGIEAASRGAEPVVLVEKDAKKRPVIGRNIAMVETGIRLVTMSAERFILTAHESFDMIFLDPPFAYEGKKRLLESVAARGLLAQSGLLLIHYPRGEVLPEQVQDIGLEQVRRYGRSWVSFYRRAIG